MAESAGLLIRRTCKRSVGSNPTLSAIINKGTMFKAVKEIIWHLTCIKCNNWFTYATMEDRLRIERFSFTCPHCGKKGGVEVNEQ